MAGIKFFDSGNEVIIRVLVGLSYSNIYQTLQYIPNKLNNTKAIIVISHSSHFRPYESHTNSSNDVKEVELLFLILVY